MKISLVCGARPRASTQNNHSKGHQWWARDVHHTSLDRLKTLCGIDCGEYLFIENSTMEEAIESNGLCRRCYTKITDKLHEGPDAYLQGIMAKEVTRS